MAEDKLNLAGDQYADEDMATSGPKQSNTAAEDNEGVVDRREALVNIGIVTAGVAATASGCLPNPIAVTRPAIKPRPEPLKLSPSPDRLTPKEKEAISQLPKFSHVKTTMNRPEFPNYIDAIKMSAIADATHGMVIKEFALLSAADKKLIPGVKLIKLLDKFKKILVLVDPRLKKFCTDYENSHGGSVEWVWELLLNEVLKLKGHYFYSRRADDKPDNQYYVDLIKITEVNQVRHNGKDLCREIQLKGHYLDVDIPAQATYDPSAGIYILIDKIITEPPEDEWDRNHNKEQVSIARYHEAMHAYVEKAFSYIKNLRQARSKVCDKWLRNIKRDDWLSKFVFCFRNKEHLSENDITRLSEVCANGAEIAQFGTDVGSKLDCGCDCAYRLMREVLVEIVIEIMGEDRAARDIPKPWKDITPEMVGKFIEQRPYNSEFHKKVGIRMYQKGLKLLQEAKPKAIKTMGHLETTQRKDRIRQGVKGARRRKGRR